MFVTITFSLKAVWSALLHMQIASSGHILSSIYGQKNTSSECYCTLEVESSRLAVEALDLSNSIKAFSKR